MKKNLKSKDKTTRFKIKTTSINKGKFSYFNNFHKSKNPSNSNFLHATKNYRVSTIS